MARYLRHKTFPAFGASYTAHFLPIVYPPDLGNPVPFKNHFTLVNTYTTIDRDPEHGSFSRFVLIERKKVAKRFESEQPQRRSESSAENGSAKWLEFPTIGIFLVSNTALALTIGRIARYRSIALSFARFMSSVSKDSGIFI